MKEKPRVRFCWFCGYPLRGNHFAERELPETGDKATMHKQCAKQFDEEVKHPSGYYTDRDGFLV